MEHLLKILDEERWDLDAKPETEDHFLADMFDDKYDAFRHGYNKALEKIRERIKELDVCDKHLNPDCMECFYTTSPEIPPLQQSTT